MSILPADPSSGPARLVLRERVAREAWAYVQATSATALAAVRDAPGAAGRQGADLLRRLAGADPGRALALVRRARRLRPGAAFFAQAEAVLTARARGWEAAEPLFLAPAATRTPGAAMRILRGKPAPAADLALPAPARAADLPAEAAARIVIYATAFGADPAPSPVFQAPPGLRFLCLTDRTDLEVPGWQTAPPPPDAPDPATRPDLTALWCRALPHRALAAAAPAAEASLYLAPDRWLVGNLHTLLTRWCLPQDLALWRHEGGIDWQDLTEHHLVAGTGAPGAVLAQARTCAARGLPRDRGAWDTGLIWRRHDAPGAAALAEAWWAAADADPAGADPAGAVSLYAALNDPAAAPAIRPRLLPAALGTAGDNVFAAVRPPAPPTRGVPAPARAGRPLALAMVYAEEYAASASTFLRGRQLGEMVAAHDPGGVDMLYTSDLACLRDRVVVLTKGALEVHSAEAIADLRARNVAVVGSWDDMLPEADKVAATDASMTLSMRQTVDFARLFPDRPAFHVTHHVNTQVRPTTPPMDRLRAGYFGLLRNTHRPDSLGRTVDLIAIATASVEMSWLDVLPNYNCHWIVRRRARDHDGWKPFLKGFLAARCNAVVVTGREDDDALQYLGDDYPFYVRSPDPKLLEYDMMGIAAAFGGPEWRFAQDIMAQVAARSTDAVVVAEFRAMVRQLTR